MSASSTNTLGRYEIIREIARSNDIVYEAIDPSINRRVALKELWIDPSVTGAQRRERIERFWREGKAAGRLSHPNIVTIYEVGKDGDRYFIAMEFLGGQTLRDAIKAGGPMPVATVKDYTLQLCSALAYAHQNGVIHRDIKPENVQILPGGHIKLTDFGIARLMGEPAITQDGQVFGTPSYMSPEQVAGKPIDARSDIFSVGVLMYEMLAGKKPFAGDSVVTITYNIMNMDPPPPPGAPPYMVGIIRKAMAKDPNIRYQSAEELAEDLRNERSSELFTLYANSPSPYPSPFGQHQAQQQSVPITPYGTPVPSSSAGGVPDPFAQPFPAPNSAPPAPSRPAISAETRNFLGILMLVVGVAGMLIFAVWAINLAYQSYVTAQTSTAAVRYYNQGVTLFNKGNLDGAEQMFQNALRVSPYSEYAEKAKDGIYKVWTTRAYTFSQTRDTQRLGDIARRMVELRPNAPEGHYYLALTQEMEGRLEEAIKEYEKASTLAGNDKAGFGSAARTRLDTLRQGVQSKVSVQPSTGSTSVEEPPRSSSEIPYEPAPGQPQ
ncbi:MAG: serine/threonine-protein kinase [Armatimonadetes bacterium]|nr:serine/threonine-protein kinase [Armatimonadota bacterium]